MDKPFASFWSGLRRDDLQLLLSGDVIVSPLQLIRCISFTGFDSKSRAPETTKAVLKQLSNNDLRRLLLVVTGSDVLPSNPPADYITVTPRTAYGKLTRRIASEHDLPYANPAIRRLELSDRSERDLLSDMKWLIHDSRSGVLQTNVDSLIRAALPLRPTFCVTCGDEIGRYQIGVGTCTHMYCNACSKGTIEWILKEAKFPARCPACVMDDGKYESKTGGEITNERLRIFG